MKITRTITVHNNVFGVFDADTGTVRKLRTIPTTTEIGVRARAKLAKELTEGTGEAYVYLRTAVEPHRYGMELSRFIEMAEELPLNGMDEMEEDDIGDEE